MSQSPVLNRKRHVVIEEWEGSDFQLSDWLILELGLLRRSFGTAPPYVTKYFKRTSELHYYLTLESVFARRTEQLIKH